MRPLSIFVLQTFFLSYCFCEFENKDNYLNEFVNHLNYLPDQPYVYEEAELIKSEEIGDSDFYIEIKVKASDQNNVYSSKYQNCSGGVRVDEEGNTSFNNVKCSDFVESWTEPMEELVTDPTTINGPIQLENEVQSENTPTSGERFIAVPRDRPAPCIGCVSFVDVTAVGVKDLADLGIKHLDRHEPNVRHSLNSVLVVERQVQVVGGVRYIMTLAVDYDNCSAIVTEACNFQKICRVSILEKPWQRLSDGSKFRAIISNNCTEEWLFEDNISSTPVDSNFNNQSNDIVNPSSDSSYTLPTEYDKIGAIDDIVKIVRNNDVQAQPTAEKSLTDEQIKILEEQIIPYSKVNQPTDSHYYVVSEATKDDVIKEKAISMEAAKPSDEFTTTQQPADNIATATLPVDKKSAIDELMNLFDFAGYKDKPGNDDVIRMKRDYGSDLQMLNLVERYQDMKTKIKNAQNIHKLAQVMVDYLNEMDIEVKTRVLQEIIRAEEEIENDQRYFYVQARVVVPCDKAQCKNKEVKICNGIIDGTGDLPSVLFTMCNKEQKEGLGNVKKVQDEDPILLKLLNRAMKKIDSESELPNAIRIKKVLSASMQKVSGTLTKIVLEIEYTTCDKSVPLFRRKNCTAAENLGFKVCDVEVLERHWLKESKITYICTDRPVDEIFISDTRNHTSIDLTKTNRDNPQVLEIVQEALQYLEQKSNRNNRQKLIEVKSVSSDQIAGLLTNIVFVAGYTACTSEFKEDVNSCILLESEPLRTCTVNVWERPWIHDGRQVNVTCDELMNIVKNRKKRSSDLNFVGNPQEKDTDNPKYKTLAEESLLRYHKESGNAQHYQFISIDKVTLQVVSGTIIKIDFRVSPTNCQVDRDGQPNSSNCYVLNADNAIVCHSKTWERPWLNSTISIDIECNSDLKKSRSRRSIQTSGDEIEEDPSEYTKLTNDCLTNYMAIYGTKEHYKVVKIERVVKVNITGDHTKINFKAAQTDCKVQNGYPTSSPCELLEFGKTLSCHAEVRVKPELNSRIMNVNCQIDEKKVRRKRDIPGGPKQRNTSDPKYEALAKKSLTKYVLRSRISQYYEVVTVEEVTSQVVSGLKTIIKFNASPTNCRIDKRGRPTSAICEIENPDTIIKCVAEIWLQPWLAKEEISVGCDPDRFRSKREATGEEVTHVPDDPKYMQLAEESLAKLVSSGGITKEHKVLQVVKVTTQVVAGTLTRVDFKVQGPANVFDCHSEAWERPWLNKTEIDVNCSPSTLRHKRRIAGGLTEKDPNDPQYMQMAKDSLAKFVSSGGITEEHKVLRVVKVTTQVVAGTMTRIAFKVQGPANVLDCHSKVWERPWLNKTEINVNCSPASSRHKRQNKLGGLTEKDPNDPQYMQMAKVSLAKFVSSGGITEEHKVLQVVKVSTQTVEGTLTRIDFQVQSPANVLDCHSKVWERPWLNKTEIDVNCSPASSRHKRRVQLGGRTEIDPNDPQYMQMAKDSLAKFVSSGGITEEHKVLQVVKVSTQTVEGTLTRIDFQVQSPANVLDCHSKVWERPWLNKTEIDVNCSPASSRHKRQNKLGGLTEKDPNDPQYMQMAKDSLAKFVSSGGITEEHKVLRVVKVTTQVVAGTMTRIAFKVQGPANVLDCHSKVWERPWLNKTEIDVNCSPASSRNRREMLLSSAARNLNSSYNMNNLQNYRPRASGGDRVEDPTKFEYSLLAAEALQKYQLLQKSGFSYKVIKVYRVVSKVVAGTKYTIDFTAAPTTCSPNNSNTDLCDIIQTTILYCRTKIWNQPWLKRKQIDILCDTDHEDEESEGEFNRGERKKRSLFNVTKQRLKDANDYQDNLIRPVDNGDEIEEDPSEYTKLTNDCLTNYMVIYETKEHYKVVKIERVVKVNITGDHTKINFKAAQTVCKVQNGYPTSSPCELLEFGKTLSCHAEVRVKPELKSRIMNVNCQIDENKVRRKRDIPGGPKQRNTSDPKYEALAKKSLTKYVLRSRISQYYEVVTVEEVTSQVVSGLKTIIKFNASPTNCRIDKRGRPTSAICEIENPDTIIKCVAEIWLQPWLAKEEISVGCHPDRFRAKRKATGGEVTHVPDEPKYMQLAEESLAKLVSSGGITDEHKVLRVVKVTTQVVAGTITRIDFKVQGPANVLDCHSKVWERPWLNKTKIDVNCSPASSRHKRQNKLGGLTEKDPNDPQYMQMAKVSLAKFVSSEGIREEHKVLQVVKVSTQTVEGTLTRIDFQVQSPANVLDCHSKVWERPWLNKTEIDVNCSPASSRHKRQNKLGGLTEKDPNDPQYMQMAKDSLAKFVSSGGITEEHKVLQVVKVSTQTVEGTLTRIDFKVQGPANVVDCQSEVWERPWLNKTEIDVNCSPASSRNKREMLLSSAARNFNSSYNMNNLKKYRPTASGGNRVEDPTKFKYSLLAAEALQKYQLKQKSGFRYKVIKVYRVVSKVVAGTIYTIYFTAAPTICSPNNSNTHFCDIIQTTILCCRTKIWDQSWLKRKQIDVFCDTDHEDEESEGEFNCGERRKRSLFNVTKQRLKDANDYQDNLIRPVDNLKENNGTEKNLTSSPRGVLNKMVVNTYFQRRENVYNSKEYVKLAQEALRKYEIHSQSDHIYKVVKILYVSEQEDVGIRVQLDFSAAPSSCLRTEYKNSSDCEFIEPKDTVSCHADIHFTLLLDANLVKTIEVKCAQRKRKIVVEGQYDRMRNKRNIPPDEYVEDDLMYYYADRAMSKVNTMLSGQNLYKLITIHDVRRTMHMRVPMVRMFFEIGKSLCLQDEPVQELSTCNEIEGLSHTLCFARMWPSLYDDLVLEQLNVVCEDDISQFVALAGFSSHDFIAASALILNRDGPYMNFYRVVGQTYLVPTLDYNEPFVLSFIAVETNCTKEYAASLDRKTRALMTECLASVQGAKSCRSQIYMTPNTRAIKYVNVSCTDQRAARNKRSIPVSSENVTNDDIKIQRLVQESLHQLEMVSVHRYKQRVLAINRYSTKITTRRETTIDFDVGYTNCLKFEWVDNITSCEFLEHLPRRHCVSLVLEQLWVDNGREVEVYCDDDETPLEANMEPESVEAASTLGKEALKRIEYKYPHPRKQVIVRIFSLEKQMIAGIHYRMKMEVGYTNCMALSIEDNCKYVPNLGINKFCRVNVWHRPWTNHPPSYRVSCDYHDSASNEIYHDIQVGQLFGDFLSTYKPSYVDDHTELQNRYKIFKDNVKKIHELNVYEMGTARYAVTRFADLAPEEFRAKYMGLNTKLRDENQVPMPQAEIPAVNIPDAFDWRDHDAVTEVKNQGMCGSCWAFSVTGNIEGQWKRHSGKLVSLSEQELVDCDKIDQGCNGGLPDNAYRAIEQLGGLETESDYPYEGEDDKCLYNSTLSRVQISGAVNISSNETNMAKWLVENGPISIGINANAMQFYVGGVSHPWKMLCNPKNLDHGVLIVGYGQKDYPLFKKKLPYWIIKNSWGPSWGEQGYYRVYRGDGTCGVNQMASSAII